MFCAPLSNYPTLCKYKDEIDAIQKTLDMHWILLSICLIVFTCVFLIILYSTWKFRRSINVNPNRSLSYHEKFDYEFYWSLVSWIIVAVIACYIAKNTATKQNVVCESLTAENKKWQYGVH